MSHSIGLDTELAEQLMPSEIYENNGWISPDLYATPLSVKATEEASGGIEILIRYRDPGEPCTEEPLDDRTDPPVLVRRAGGGDKIARLYVPPQHRNAPPDRDALVMRLNEAALRQKRDNWRLNFKFIANILAAHWNDLFPSTEGRNGH